MPIAVMPTCAVEMTRTGSSISRRAARAPALPASARGARAERRAVMTEYSPTTKNALAPTRPSTASMRRTSLTLWVLPAQRRLLLDGVDDLVHARDEFVLDE